METIAERLLDYKERFGDESIVTGYGTGRDNEAVIYRFANPRSTTGKTEKPRLREKYCQAT